MRVFYINLDDRIDRRQRIETMFERLGLNAMRIPAIESSAIHDGVRFLSSPEIACWYSHLRTLEVVASLHQDEIALVLEDDAVLQEDVDWSTFQTTLAKVFRDNQLDLLQIGYLSRRQLWGYGPSLIYDSYLRFRTRWKRIETPIGCIYLHEFLPGTHAYLISSTSAKRLLGLNTPPTLPADGFFESLAMGQQSRNYFRIARCETSFVSQANRNKQLKAQDSDISRIDPTIESPPFGPTSG